MRIRAQRNKVELERGGNDGKWIRSQSTITRTITHTITNTITNVLQLRSQRAEEEEEDRGTTQEWTLSYFANIGALPGLQQGLHGRACQRLRRPIERGCQRLRPRGQNERQRLLEKSGHYPILRTLALSKIGNYCILRALALSKSGNYRIS